MGANDDLAFPALDIFFELGSLSRACHPGQDPNLEREAAKTVRKRLAVLAGEQCCRRDHRNLIPGHGNRKGRPHRNLGLAKTDITADQPVHHLTRAKITHDIINRIQLIFGFGIGETLAEFGIGAGIGDNRLRRCCLAQGRNADQLFGNITDPPLDAGLPRLPRCPAEFIELGLTALLAIAGQQINVLHRQKQLVTTGIDDQQAIMINTGCGDFPEALIPADAVINMDNQITGIEAGDFPQEILPAPAPTGGAGDAAAVDILFRDQHQPGERKSILDRPDGRIDLALADSIKPGHRLNPDPTGQVFGNQLIHAGAGAFG